MTTFIKEIQEPYFSYIKEGLKTIEGRLIKRDWADMKVGDKIVFMREKAPFGERFSVEIVNIHKTKSFEELYKQFGSKLLPNVKNNDVEDAINIYRKFFTRKEEEEYGVMGIEMKLFC